MLTLPARLPTKTRPPPIPPLPKLLLANIDEVRRRLRRIERKADAMAAPPFEEYRNRRIVCG